MENGVDISHWQNPIDWSKVKQDFVMIKASGGDKGLYKDVRFDTFKNATRAKGVCLGYYHFAGGLDPVKEADFFLTSVGDLAVGEVLALDFEIHIADPIGFCTKFVNRIKDKAGFWPLFYSYSSLAALFTTGDVLNCGLWIADPSANAPRIGKWNTWAIWQYTTAPANKIAGFSTTVDLDYFNGTAEQFKKYGKPMQTYAETTQLSPPAQVVNQLSTTPSPVVASIPDPVVSTPIIPETPPVVEQPAPVSDPVVIPTPIIQTEKLTLIQKIIEFIRMLIN